MDQCRFSTDTDTSLWSADNEEPIVISDDNDDEVFALEGKNQYICF